MSKIVCDVCGTSYPAASSNCPICGSVHAVGRSSSGNTVAENKTGSTYQAVRGGRFSTANVQRRNKASSAPVKITNSKSSKNANTGKAAQPTKRVQPAKNTKPVRSTQPARPTTANKKVKKENDRITTGLTITAVILVLLIIAVVVYIGLRFFGSGLFGDTTKKPGTSQTPQNSQSAQDPQNQLPQQTQGQQNPGSVEVPCAGLTLDVDSIVLDEIGVSRMIYVSASPADTTDPVSFVSSDESVVVVSADGKVTAVGPGEAEIKVTCGAFTKTCYVACTDATEESTVETTEETKADEQFMLNRADITFSKPGESWLLYSGNIAKNQIVWTTDDANIASIEAGKVVAEGSGTTTVYGEYNGEKVSCIIRCNFSSSSQGVTGNGGGITEDG